MPKMIEERAMNMHAQADELRYLNIGHIHSSVVFSMLDGEFKTAASYFREGLKETGQIKNPEIMVSATLLLLETYNNHREKFHSVGLRLEGKKKAPEPGQP